MAYSVIFMSHLKLRELTYIVALSFIFKNKQVNCVFIYFQNALTDQSEYDERFAIKPFMPDGMSHPYQLDESILNSRVVRY